MASRNIRVALMIAVAFVVTLHVVNQRNTEKYLNFRRERFEGHEDEGKNPQDSEVNASDFTTNVDEQFADHPLAEDITPKDTFENGEPEPESYITPKDTFANVDEPEDYITPKDTFANVDEPEDYITQKIPSPTWKMNLKITSPKRYLRNYRLEQFKDESEDAPHEGPGSKEHMDPEAAADEVDGFQPNVEEGDDVEESDDVEEGEDEPEGFYSNINPTVKNFGVNPAYNTAGKSTHLFAPVNFN